MLDRLALKVGAVPLNGAARLLRRAGVSANAVTWAGLSVGLAVIPLLATGRYAAAALAIVANRILDGIDGALARQTAVTARGGFIDITFDFLFYSAVPFGFALANPGQNALPAAALIYSFVGTGASFLAYAAIMARRAALNPAYPPKSLYYSAGIAEATETIAVFLVCCLVPDWFPPLAWGFAGVCWLTTAVRIGIGWTTLKG
jgi:phosphatidylglycerophosphate synthase